MSISFQIKLCTWEPDHSRLNTFLSDFLADAQGKFWMEIAFKSWMRFPLNLWQLVFILHSSRWQFKLLIDHKQVFHIKFKMFRAHFWRRGKRDARIINIQCCKTQCRTGSACQTQCMVLKKTTAVFRVWYETDLLLEKKTRSPLNQAGSNSTTHFSSHFLNPCWKAHGNNCSNWKHWCVNICAKRHNLISWGRVEYNSMLASFLQSQMMSTHLLSHGITPPSYSQTTSLAWVSPFNGDSLSTSRLIKNRWLLSIVYENPHQPFIYFYLSVPFRYQYSEKWMLKIKVKVSTACLIS